VLRGRKGGFDTQLNWIFIVAAGAVILAFFFAAIQKQKSFSEQKVSDQLKTGFEGIFVGAQASSDTIFTMPIPADGVGFSCSEECDCRFTIGRANAPFGDKLMFAPSLVEGSEMTLWALDYKLPFRVATFVMITSPFNRFVFVTDDAQDPLLQELKLTWPKNMSFEVITPDRVLVHKNHNDPDTTFVFLSDPVFTLDESFREQSASGVVIRSQGDDHSVLFLKKRVRTTSFTEDGSAVAVHGTSGIIAAIFSANRDMFVCNTKTAYNRLRTISKIYAGRARTLAQVAAPECEYERAASLLEEELLDWAKEAGLQAPAKIDQNLKNVLTSLEVENDRLQDLSCPYLY